MNEWRICINVNVKRRRSLSQSPYIFTTHTHTHTHTQEHTVKNIEMNRMGNRKEAQSGVDRTHKN